MSAVNLLTNVSSVLNNDDSHDHTNSADKSSINFAKTITIFALFFISMSSGIVPFFLSRWFNWSEPNRDPRTNLVVSSLLSFGGGALLCTTLMHLLPEIDETIADLQLKGHLPEWDFSLSNLLMAIGFFIIYLVEELVHAYLEKQQKQQANVQKAFVRGHSARESLRDANTRGEHEKKPATDGVINISTTDLVRNEHVHDSHNHHEHSHVIPVIDGDDLLVSSIRGLLIVLALSVHELFEGMAVGLEQSTSTVWYMFGSVAAHKVVIAFCIGVELMVHKTKTWLVVLYIFVYAIVSPIGIGVGMALSNANDSEAIAVSSVILQGLASGTLLYVIFFEILTKHKDGIVQYFSVVFGFALMFGFKLSAGHNHVHEGLNKESNHGHSHNH